MRIGIDASNLSSGGGVTHLVSILRELKPEAHDVDQVVVWAPQRTLDRIEARLWLRKCADPVLEKGYLHRALWQRFSLGRLASEAGCDLLFVPGGSFATRFRPVVTMSRNMLPFEWDEMRRYRRPALLLKLLLLRWSQSRSFRKADGVIFLTQYAKSGVLKQTGCLAGSTTIIPHGVDGSFQRQPRPQDEYADRSVESPVRLLYVSHIEPYKHQWHVLDAVSMLREKGLPVTIDFVGPPGNANSVFLRALRNVERSEEFASYRPGVDHAQLPALYGAADIFVYASSCENLPNILLEAMASGLPIACSDRGPMPEVLGDAGVYFDPEDAVAIAYAVERLILSSAERREKAETAFSRALSYSWARCADQTFSFLSQVHRLNSVLRLSRSSESAREAN